MSRTRLDADDAASLRQELAWLRKRDGFTASRLVHAPIVDEVLRGSLEDSFERLRHRFVSAIHSLSESGSEQDEPLVGVLLAAFALSPETAGSGSLLERRRAMASRLGCSMETIASREEAGLRLGDEQFAREIYRDIRDQAIRAAERWYDVTVRVRLSTAVERSTAGTPLLDVTVEWEYTTIPSSATRRFACVSNQDEYNELR